jgi:hypothetical protein
MEDLIKKINNINKKRERESAFVSNDMVKSTKLNDEHDNDDDQIHSDDQIQGNEENEQMQTDDEDEQIQGNEEDEQMQIDDDQMQIDDDDEQIQGNEEEEDEQMQTDNEQMQTEDEEEVFKTTLIDLFVILNTESLPIKIEFDISWSKSDFSDLYSYLDQAETNFNNIYNAYWEGRLRNGFVEITKLRNLLHQTISENPDDDDDQIPETIIETIQTLTYPLPDSILDIIELNSLDELNSAIDGIYQFFEDSIDNVFYMDDELKFPELVSVYLPGTYGHENAEVENAQPIGLNDVGYLIESRFNKNDKNGQLPWVIEMDFVNDAEPPSYKGEIWREYYVTFRMNGITDFFKSNFPKRYVNNKIYTITREQEGAQLSLIRKRDDDIYPFSHVPNEILEHIRKFQTGQGRRKKVRFFNLFY